MLYSGLTSVTFRNMSATEVINIAKEGKLDAIEWGGDIHAPPSDLDNAGKLGKMTREAGLAVSSYGSYWRGDDIESFKTVLQCAVALGAPMIRVWAGSVGADNIDKNAYELLINNLSEAAKMAESENICVAVEYHSDTLTDSLESTIKLLEKTRKSGLMTYWQPPVGSCLEDNLTAIRALSSRLANIHVFSWDKYERLRLIEYEHMWYTYTLELTRLGNDRYMLLEFVKDDDPKQFISDSRVLKRLIDEAKRGV